MIQVTSDSPNVNPCILEILGEKRRDENLTMLIDLATCVLHKKHNAFKHGVAYGQIIRKLMSSLHKIFKESPSQHAN